MLVTVGVASVAGSSTGSKEAHKKLQSQVLDEHNKEVHKAIQGVSTSVLQLLGAAWSGERCLIRAFLVMLRSLATSYPGHTPTTATVEES